MRRVLATAMLCLLLMVSVAGVRCDAQCTAARMPVTTQAAPSADSAMTMDSGMEHCSGMQRSSSGISTVSCKTTMCQHQALPSTADARIDTDGTPMLQPIVLQMTAVVVLHAHPAWDGFNRSPLLLRSPLDQGSSLRV